MQGVLMDREVYLPLELAKGLVEAGYGREKGDVLVLSPIEACYLVHTGRLELRIDEDTLGFEELFTRLSATDPMFELWYIVYRDLKERGYSVAVQPSALRLYPRGAKPQRSASHLFVHVLGEREAVRFEWVAQRLDELAHIRKRMALAVVDEDGDITYYEVKRVHLKTMKDEVNPPKARATLLWDRAFVWNEDEARTLYGQMYGTMLDEHRLQLSLIETLYLAQKGILEVHQPSGEHLSAERIEGLVSELDEEDERRLMAYTHLREHGYVPKSGYKFGSHFRMYDTDDSREHSTYLVHVLPLERVLFPPELSRAIRLAHSVHKRMVFACTHDDQITYIEMGWFRP
ncbi:MAG: tRNA-intron lyase [Methermicoccaceae archaeon]